MDSTVVCTGMSSQRDSLTPTPPGLNEYLQQKIVGLAFYFVFQTSNALSCHLGATVPWLSVPGQWLWPQQCGPPSRGLSGSHHARQWWGDPGWGEARRLTPGCSWPGAHAFYPTCHQMQPLGHKVNLNMICHHPAQPGQGSHVQQFH